MEHSTVPSDVPTNSRACDVEAAAPGFPLAHILKHRRRTFGGLPATWLDCLTFVVAFDDAKTPATFLQALIEGTCDRMGSIQREAGPSADSRSMATVMRSLVAIERLSAVLVKAEASEQAREAQRQIADSALRGSLVTIAGIVDALRVELSERGDTETAGVVACIESSLLVALEAFATAVPR